MQPIGVGGFTNKNPLDAKKAAIEAAKAKALGTSSDPAAAIIKYIPPGECAERIRLEFDDSGSMYGHINNAKRGVVEFLRNCVPNSTSVAVHFMNTTAYPSELKSNLPLLGQEITELQLEDGGTPFFNTMKNMLQATPRLTRLVAFTDGSPTDALEAEGSGEVQSYGWRSRGNWISSADVIIKIASSVEAGKIIPIDTVFFGHEHNVEEIKLLKYLSDKTGGFFLHFNPATPNIWKQLKYLAPVNRLALTDGAFRAAVERGEK